MKAFPRAASVAVALAASLTALYAPGCGGDDHPHDAGATNAAVADVVFGDGTNDEALLALLAATPTMGGPTAPSWLSPAAGSQLLATEAPPTFSWSEPTAALAPRRRQPRFSVGEGVAHAHGTVTNGRAYFLVVGTASNRNMFRAFTKASTVALPSTVWDGIRQSPGPLQITVVTGVFDNGRLTQGSAAAMAAVTIEVK